MPQPSTAASYWQHGFTVDQVVHDYRDLCQAITDLAFELNAGIEIGEFRSLNRCLDNAIAQAVTEFTYRRDLMATHKHADELNERLGVFAQELRNLLSIASLSLAALRSGNVGLTGATGAMLDRSLVGMRNLIDRSNSHRVRGPLRRARAGFDREDVSTIHPTWKGPNRTWTRAYDMPQQR